MEAENLYQNCRRCVFNALLRCLSSPHVHPHVALCESFNHFQKLSDVEQYHILKNQCENLIQASVVNFQLSMVATLDINTCYSYSKSYVNAIIEYMLPYWLTNILPAYISAQCELGPFTHDEYNKFV